MIILYGGTFNPPTVAHLEIAQYLINKYKPVQFIFIPVGSSYNKPNVVSFHHRLRMLEIIVKQLHHASVSDFENKMTHFKGTIETLHYFQSQYKNQSIYFVMGADNFITIDNWIRIEEMVKSYRFIILNRNQLPIQSFIKNHPLLSNYKEHFLIEEDLPLINISSTNYREEFCDEVVIEEVNDYIYAHKLYNRGVINEK